MGKGRHVVIHDVIHDDNEMRNRPISYQDVARPCMKIVIFTHNLGNWLISTAIIQDNVVIFDEIAGKRRTIRPGFRNTQYTTGHSSN